MALRVDAEKWCALVMHATTNSPRCCGDAAITLCSCCGIGICEVHELVCLTCSASTCPSCQHACSVDLYEHPVLAA
jgi:hypothetical protein